MSQDFAATRLTSQSIVAPLKKPSIGGDSLATRESKRPRSNSLKNRGRTDLDADLFESDSDMFSALNPSNSELSSVISNHDEQSPDRKP